MDFVVSPTIAATPQSGGQPAPLSPGQVLDALVLAVLKDGLVRISVADTLLDVHSQVPLEAGATLRFLVKSGPDGLRLAVVPGSIHSPPAGQVLPTLHGGVAPQHQFGANDASGTDHAGAATPASVQPAIKVAPASVGTQASPSEALSSTVRLAVTRQGGLAPLFALIERLVTKPDSGPQRFERAPVAFDPGSAALPAAVRPILERLLLRRVPLDETFSAQALKEAFARSGLFLERNLAAGGSDPGDLKALLTRLQDALQSSNNRTLNLEGSSGEELRLSAPAGALSREAGAATRSAPLASSQPLPPPYKGGPTIAQPAIAPAEFDDIPSREIVQRLLNQTDATLSRHTLLQAASLPELAAERAVDSPRWLFEVPLTTAQGTSIGQFEIGRDGQRAGDTESKPVWRARFSVDIEPLGPVHAHVALTGARATVALWAERPSSAEGLRAQARELAIALTQADIEPADIQVRVGEPRPPQASRSPSGRFLDRAS